MDFRRDPTSAVPYVAPMALFMALLWAGPKLGLGSWEYPLRVVILTVALWLTSRHVIQLRPRFALASMGIGVAVFILWIGPDLLVPGWRTHWLFQNSVLGKLTTTAPAELAESNMAMLFRTIRAAILVPIIEELFWRAWLMRWLIRNDFWKAPLGAFTPMSFIVTAALFASEHGPYWEVGLLTGFVYNWWMIRTKSLADCILAHAVTNAILSGYVIASGKWEYWL